MTASRAVPQPLDKPGIASAEDGVVVLDGPSGTALTMTAEAAAQTGQNLISAAEIAAQQKRTAQDEGKEGER